MLFQPCVDFGLCEPVTAQEGAELPNIAPLADTRRMIHQADEGEAGMRGIGEKQLLHVGGRQFTAQMEQMVGFQQPGFGQAVEIGDALDEGALAILLEAEIADAEGIENRGDARARALGVMGDHGGAGRPARIDARLHLALEVVGMEVDDAGDEQVAGKIDRACGVARSGRDSRNAAQACDEAALDDLIGEDQAPAGENRLIGHGRLLRSVAA